MCNGTAQSPHAARNPAGRLNDAQLYDPEDRSTIVQLDPPVLVKSSAVVTPDPNAAISESVASGPAARAATA
jgi:hypothetical protein